MDYGEREEAFFHPVPCIEYLVCSRGKLCCAGGDVRNREGLAVCAAPVAWALLNEDAIRLLWNHWRKGTALDWQTPTMVPLLIAAFAYVVCCVAIGISG